MRATIEMFRIRAFSGTLVAFVVALGVLSVHRTWLLDFWLSPLLDVVSPHAMRNPSGAVVMLEVTVASALLLTYPIFSAEAWILLCRMSRRERARRLTVPFAFTSAAVAALAFWLARHIPWSAYLVPL